MSSKENAVDQKQLMRYIEIEKTVQQLEGQNVLKNFEIRKKNMDDVGETIKQVEITLQQLELQTKKEKKDVDDLQKASIKDMFKDQAAFDKQMTREQEEYLEARNKEEVTRQQLDGLKKQQKDLESKANEIKNPAEKLKALYEERDSLLSDIFNGDYGSDMENKLEGMFDTLMDRKQRVSVAHYKWTSARVLLQHAVNQLSHAVNKWKDILKIPQQNTNLKYLVATEVRNNNIAAMQNVDSCQRYLGDEIKFPYCKKTEMDTLARATENCYIDMQDPGRHKHALDCYDVTMRRASALLQWFDNVITGTIQKDLKDVTTEARGVEQKLRAERIRLIRAKVEESGGDVKGLNDADESKLSDADMDMQGIGITRPAPVGDDHGVPDAKQEEHGPPPPTPLPLNELAPMPTENDLFGDISELKEQYRKNNEDFMKAQDLNKARMEQGLQAKLQARRHKKMK